MSVNAELTLPFGGRTSCAGIAANIVALKEIRSRTLRTMSELLEDITRHTENGEQRYLSETGIDVVAAVSLDGTLTLITF
ncbi:hypothetical protein [Paenibacillus humicus]|uniref:hypothetical protein n=1 Tax=Paenibacillus humicus TaxID=412861 RepID=UPI000FD9F6B1|nr:hypothetical protein [Paenibacillus humicus]